ncbi:MAG: hypothetical protein R2752_08365 [Vicinamibacterales bacterium]
MAPGGAAAVSIHQVTGTGARRSAAAGHVATGSPLQIRRSASALPAPAASTWIARA